MTPLLESLYDRLNEVVTRLVNLLLRGVSDPKQRSARYGRTISEVWTSVGVIRKGKLRDITDPDRLQRMLEQLTRRAERLENE